MGPWNPALGIPLLAAGLVVLLVVYLTGRRGRRSTRKPPSSARIEPRLGGAGGADTANPVQAELDRLGRAVSTTAHVARPEVGARAPQWYDKIVTLYVVAGDGRSLAGTDVVVAAEKAGLEFGDRGIFHRVASGAPASAPVFSVANMLNPGSFDMTRLEALRTPGLTLFMTLPGPIPALEAWEMMLPTAQRLAELLGAQVLDEHRNALGRQRIAHLRDELREWDRRQERRQVHPES